MFAIRSASWLGRSPHQPMEVSHWSSVALADRDQDLLHWSLPASNGPGYDLVPDSQPSLLFTICPGDLANDFSVVHSTVCPHTLSLCVFSFQMILNVYPSHPVRTSPNSNQLVQPKLLEAQKGTSGHFRLLEAMTSGDPCRPDQT